MPQVFPNAYAYESPIGQGLQNIARMLLADDGGAKAAMNAAHMQAYRAQADKLRADAEQTAQQTSRTQNFLPNFASNLVGADGPQALRYYQGATETIPAYEDEAKQMTMAPTVAKVQRPASLDDAKLQMLSRAALLAAAPAGSAGVSMENLAHGLERMGKTQAYDGVLSGAVDPSRYTIAEGKPLYHFGETYAGNVVTGEQKQNALGQAKVGTEKAHQGALGAQANNYNASAREHNRTDVLTTVPHPFIAGATLQVPARIAFAEGGRNTRATDKNENDLIKEEIKNGKRLPNGEIPLKLGPQVTKDMSNLMRQELQDYFLHQEGMEAGDGKIDPKTGINSAIEISPALFTSILSKATALAQDPQSGFGQNAPGAVRAAFEQARDAGVLQGTRTDVQWLPGMFSPRAVRATTTASTPITTAPSVVPPAQRVENNGSSNRPISSSSNSAVEEAKAAIAKGAPPDKVRARLQQNGINPALAGL